MLFLQADSTRALRLVHDPDNITFQNRCQSCDKKYFTPVIHTPTTQPINPTLNTERSRASETPTPSVVAKNHHNSSIIGVSSIELISQLSSRTSTPNAMNADEADLFLEDFDVEVQGDTSAKADISVPDWFSLGLDTIYDTSPNKTRNI